VITWRYFARKTFPEVVRELDLLAATANYSLDTCPLHGDTVGKATHLCKECFGQAWAEVQAPYRDARQGAGKRKEETMHDNEEPDTITIPSEELVPAEQAPTLFLTHDPDTFIARASEAAGALARVIHERDLFTRIRGREHVHVEGWTLLGSLLGVFPITEWTRRIDDGWEARVVAKTRAGELVGAAESMCTPKESKWRSADEYAIRSMAATRATSKALRLPLGFVMELAGFDPTPAEEMPDGADGADSEAKPKTSPVDPVQATPEQLTEIRTLLGQLAELDPDTDWVARCREIAGVPARLLTKGGAGYLINKLRDELARRQERAGA
jgi:hypothetical protein